MQSKSLEVAVSFRGHQGIFLEQNPPATFLSSVPRSHTTHHAAKKRVSWAPQSGEGSRLPGPHLWFGLESHSWLHPESTQFLHDSLVPCPVPGALNEACQM